MQHRLGQARGLLVDERRGRPGRRIRRRATCGRRAGRRRRALPGEPLRGALEALVLGEALGQLLGRALGVELLLVLGLGIDEQARLQLAERRDEHEELRERLEIDLVGALELREVGQHDVDDRHLDELELLAQDEREQQVERPRERVEVEVELENGSVHTRIVATTPDACGAGRHATQVMARSIAGASAASQRSCAATWSR